MKKKFSYVMTAIAAVFVGIIGTVLVVHYFPIGEDASKETINKTVSITEENSIKEAINKIYDAVVLITSYKNDKAIGTGTGFVYKKDNTKGYIMTNHHVIDGATSIKVTNIEGEEVDAKVLGSDNYADIAVLSVDKASVLSVAEIGDSTKSEIGDTIFTVGSPLGANYMGTVTKGILSGKDRMVEVSTNNDGYMMQVLQTDAAMNPGNSGGPLVNINGQVIGINSIKLVEDEIEGMGFAIPIEMAMSSVEKLEKGEKIVRPLVGVEMIDAANTYSLYYNKIDIDKSITYGVVIATVQNDTPASRAGFQKGDVITEIDGTKIDSLAKFRFTLYKYSIGDKVKVKFYRGKDLKEVTMTLDKEA